MPSASGLRRGKEARDDICYVPPSGLNKRQAKG